MVNGKSISERKINFKTKFYTFFMILEQKPVFAKTCRFFHLDCLRFLSKNLQAKQAIEKPVRTLMFKHFTCMSWRCLLLLSRPIAHRGRGPPPKEICHARGADSPVFHLCHRPSGRFSANQPTIFESIVFI